MGRSERRSTSAPADREGDRLGGPRPLCSSGEEGLDSYGRSALGVAAWCSRFTEVVSCAKPDDDATRGALATWIDRRPPPVTAERGEPDGCDSSMQLRFRAQVEPSSAYAGGEQPQHVIGVADVAVLVARPPVQQRGLGASSRWLVEVPNRCDVGAHLVPTSRHRPAARTPALRRRAGRAGSPGTPSRQAGTTHASSAAPATSLAGG